MQRQAIKLRLYPTSEQQEVLAQHYGLVLAVVLIMIETVMLQSISEQKESECYRSWEPGLLLMEGK